MNNTSNAIVVTRHDALVDLINEDFPGVDIMGVYAHADAQTVEGKTVFGILPMDLAAKAEMVVSPVLKLTPEMRGKELSLDEMKQVFQGWKAYIVTEVDVV